MSKVYPQVLPLITVFESFALAMKISEGTASGHVLGAGHRIDALRAGGDMGVRALNRAMQIMSNKWPEDSEVVWPEGIERPKPVRTEAKPKRKR